MESNEHKIVKYNKTIFIFLITCSILITFYPILFLVTPLSILKILIYPLWVAIQEITLLIIAFTGMDVWLARGLALLICSSLTFFFVGLIGNLLGIDKVIFKREKRLLVVVTGCLICIGMYFSSKNVHFSTITGEPLKKYYKSESGRIELFPIEMNYHPRFGEKLNIINKEIITLYEEQNNSINTNLTLINKTNSISPKNESHLSINKHSNIEEINTTINSGVNISHNSENIAVMFIIRNNEIDYIDNRFYNLINLKNVNIINTYFTNSFYNNGYFKRIDSGETSLLNKAHVFDDLDYVILGHINYSFRKNESIDKDLVSCDIKLSYKIINKNATVIRSDVLKVIGPGFTEDQSLERGLEILAEKYSEILSSIL